MKSAHKRDFRYFCFTISSLVSHVKQNISSQLSTAVKPKTLCMRFVMHLKRCPVTRPLGMRWIKRYATQIPHSDDSHARQIFGISIEYIQLWLSKQGYYTNIKSNCFLETVLILLISPAIRQNEFWQKLYSRKFTVGKIFDNKGFVSLSAKILWFLWGVQFFGFSFKNIITAVNERLLA